MGIYGAKRSHPVAIDAGRPVRFEDGEPAAAMCKLFGLEAVGRVTDRALLVGYTRASPIERLPRDAPQLA